MPNFSLAPSSGVSTFGHAAKLQIRSKRPAKRNLLCCAKPRIALKFQTAEGPVEVECDSGDILRDVMLEQKVDLYTTWGKVWQCGGNGQCGTCVVKVLEGSKLLSDRNETEEKKLKRKSTDYRLACQTNVGNGKNRGRITVQTKP